MLDANALWLTPGLEHPGLKRYANFFKNFFRQFEALDYRALYLQAGPKRLERAIMSAMDALQPQLLLYSQFPSSYSYISPNFIASLRSRCAVVGLGYDDEIYFEQAKYFYQACSCIVTTDIAGAAWSNEIGIPAHLVATAWLDNPPPSRLEEDLPVSFVGDLSKPGRREFIEHLERQGIPVADYGIASRNGPAAEAGVRDIFRRSKINLNFTGTNPPRWVLRHDPLRALASQVKARPFELAAMGRFCLCQWAPCVSYWFHPDVDIGVFYDRDDLVAQVRRYLADERLRQSISASAKKRYGAELAPDLQFTRAFSLILHESALANQRRFAPSLGGQIFYESMGRSRGVAFLHALHRGRVFRAFGEMFMKWSWRASYWRGFLQAALETIAGGLRRA